MGKEDWYDDQFDWGCRRKAAIVLTVSVIVFAYGAFQLISKIQKGVRS